MNDESLMPFGKYKGVKMANVPAAYLIWLYENANIDNKLKTYIMDNMDVLKSEINKNTQRG